MAKNFTVLLVDPSGFSPSYDYCLGSALTRQSCNVLLATRPGLEIAWNDHPNFTVWAGFYPFTSTRPGLRRWPWLRANIKAAEHLRGLGALAELVERQRPNIVHFQWLPLPLVDRFVVRRIRKVAPAVFTLHDTNPFHGWPTSKAQNLAFYRALREFDCVIVHTQYSRQRVLEAGWVSEERVRVIPHGVFDYYRDLEPEPVVLPDRIAEKKIVLLFGALKPYKGLDVLLHAFAHLPPHLKAKSALVVAGNAMMDIRPMKRLADQLGVASSIHWQLGFVPDRQVPSLFRSAQVVVLPYREIDQSGVLMTALAFDRPIVASHIGGFPEILEDGVHGYLFPEGNAFELAAALARLLEDESHRREMGEAVGRLGHEKFAWQTIAQQTIRLYQEIRPCTKEI